MASLTCSLITIMNTPATPPPPAPPVFSLSPRRYLALILRIACQIRTWPPHIPLNLDAAPAQLIAPLWHALFLDEVVAAEAQALGYDILWHYWRRLVPGGREYHEALRGVLRRALIEVEVERYYQWYRARGRRFGGVIIARERLWGRRWTI